MRFGGNTNDPPKFSKEQLEEHNRLYPEAHATKLKEIEARLIRADTTCVDPTYCPLRSLKKEQAYALNSVRLHDLYFGNIGNEGSQPSAEVMTLLERDFGSKQEWEKQFAGLARCSRGWVVLGFDLKDGVLRNFFADDHSEGVWSVLPLLVLDVYEHAYCKVFSTRDDYVESFLKLVRWEAVNRRLKAVKEFYQSIAAIL
ncbi:Superoxide dismutase (Fe) [Pelotomaculum sp. FP]|uniref:superoxide dismutase n=1 Tax=Pelotomaculum sp. FP TaxID=261474 RepID=UPI001064BD58|nr:Fe-Mn family superoxide dismutase [Pelotomaculum sp. FP]TEB16332.1 Superoxide dismutase (Fe) [Pelotomaculum sp. FP]